MNTSKLVALIMPLCISSNLVSMEPEISQYYTDCRQIFEKHNKKFEHYKATANREDLSKTLPLLEQKLTQYKENLLQQKQKLPGNHCSMMELG